MTSEELAGRILYRDALAIILDKPAGLPVHAGPKNASERNGDGSVPLTEIGGQPQAVLHYTWLPTSRPSAAAATPAIRLTTTFIARSRI